MYFLELLTWMHHNAPETMLLVLLAGVLGLAGLFSAAIHLLWGRRE